MKHRCINFLFMLLSMVILSGCWDRAELQDLDIVSAIGIDKGSDEVDNRYMVTVQVINEGQIAGSPSQGGGKEISPVTSYTATGSTVSEALRKIGPKIPQELFFPHIQLMVIGEELAKETGIQDLFDWLERDSQFRTLFPILVVKNNTAKNVLKILTSLEPIPSAKIVGGLESTQKTWGEFVSTRADKVIKQLAGNAAIITGVQIIGDPDKGNSLKNVQQISTPTELEIKGIGIFKKGKLQKWLEGDKARGAMLINDEVTKTVVDINCNKKKKGLSIDMMRSKTKIKAKVINNKPIINITVRSEGHISEVHCPIDLSKHKVIEKLEKQMEKELKEEILLALETTKKEKSDIFRFGEKINIENPKLWKQIKNQWDEEIYPETEVNVKVQSFIRRSGLRTKPYFK
jgi:spore germination protein KC